MVILITKMELKFLIKGCIFARLCLCRLCQQLGILYQFGVLSYCCAFSGWLACNLVMFFCHLGIIAYSVLMIFAIKRFVSIELGI
jgi:hypothetical protein